MATSPAIVNRTQSLKQEGYPVAFIEKKFPDWARVAQLCAVSEREGHWANFGPLSERLAAFVHELNGLPAGCSVIAASSGTAALHALTGMHSVRAGRTLTWLVSAFGFYSSVIGPLVPNIRLVDSDSSGLLDLESVKQLNVDDWDGMIVTNTFGLASDLQAYEQICKAYGKILVVDSALAYPVRGNRTGCFDEMLSFHHTKPWGFGEGGCAIVARDNESLVRSLLNFGIGLDERCAPYAANGKMSDIAAAPIVERLERFESWSPLYIAQTLRISHFASCAGLILLGGVPEGAITGHLAVLRPSTIELDAVPQCRFVCRKYYRPLAPGFAVASDLFRRIINVPCHPGMAAISDAELEEFFASLVQR